MSRHSRIRAILAVEVKSIIANFDMKSKKTVYTLIAVDDSKGEYHFKIGEYESVTTETEEHINQLSSYISSQDGRIEVMTYLRGPLTVNNTEHAAFYLDSSFKEPSELLMVLGFDGDESFKSVPDEEEPEVDTSSEDADVNDVTEEDEKAEENITEEHDSDHTEETTEDVTETEDDTADNSSDDSLETEEVTTEQVGEDIHSEVSNESLYDAISEHEGGTEPFRQAMIAFSDQVISKALKHYPKSLTGIFNSIVLHAKSLNQDYQGFKGMYDNFTEIDESKDEIILFYLFNSLASTNKVKQIYTEAISTYLDNDGTVEDLQDLLMQIKDSLKKEGQENHG